MTSVWFVSPAFRRYEITRLCLAQRREVVASLRARGFDCHSLIVADDENLDIAREYGSEALEWENQPVGDKFNAGIRHACLEGGADFVVYVGSDDWVHPSLLDPLPFRGQRKKPVITGRQIAFVDLVSGKLTRADTDGVIPWVLPRRLIEPVAFEPVRAVNNRGLDGSLVRRLARYGIKIDWHFHDPHPMCRVDFKSGVNITPYHKVRGAFGEPEEEPDPWGALGELYGPELVGLARGAHEHVRRYGTFAPPLETTRFRHTHSGLVKRVEVGSARERRLALNKNWTRC